MKVGTYLDEIIEYDPEKRHFFAMVDGKVLTHKQQNKLEKLIEKAKRPKKRRGRPPKESMQPVAPTKRRGRPRKRPASKPVRRIGPPPLWKSDIPSTEFTTPADQIKDLDDVDTMTEALIAKIDRCSTTKAPIHAAFAVRARQVVVLARDIVKDVIRANYTDSK